jgi:hypothetical protein
MPTEAITATTTSAPKDSNTGATLATAPAETTQAPVTAAAPPVAPVTETAPAPVLEAVKTEQAKAPEVAKATPDTVLGEALDKKPAETPKEPPKTEAKVESTEKKTEEGKSDEPAPLPVYDAFKLPEGVTLEADRVAEFTKVLSDLETSGKVPHDLVQKFGQTMVDTHIAEVKKATDALTAKYLEVWDNQKTEWKDSFLKDPEIGGNRFQTTVDSALSFIRTHGGTSEQQTEFRNLMNSSGLGNHPAVIRLLANAGRAMAEGKPLVASKPAPQAKSKVETMYGKTA